MRNHWRFREKTTRNVIIGAVRGCNICISVPTAGGIHLARGRKGRKKRVVGEEEEQKKHKEAGRGVDG